MSTNLNSYILALVFVFSVFFSPPALAEPWSVSGQTDLDGNPTIDDPQANLVGGLGEHDWPYQVPAGKQLTIEWVQFEGQHIKQPGGGFDIHARFAIVLWVSDFENDFATNDNTLSTCLMLLETKTCPYEYTFPAGKWIHMRILNPRLSKQVHGWHVWGDLTDIP